MNHYDNNELINLCENNPAGNIMSELDNAESYNQEVSAILTITVGCSNFLTIICCK